jgi:hypothetical protein
MIDEPHRSQAAAYGGLIEDVRNDGIMLDQFIPVAMQVNDLDIKRNKALESFPSFRRVNTLMRRRACARMFWWCSGCSNVCSSALHLTDGRSTAWSFTRPMPWQPMRIA